jgi:hypothetical protein
LISSKIYGEEKLVNDETFLGFRNLLKEKMAEYNDFNCNETG